MELVSSNQKLLNGLKLLKPSIHRDFRGFFYESYNKNILNKLLDEKIDFVQDNISLSGIGTIRGLHFQKKNPQGKLIRVIKGKILDVVVDLRKDSSSFGKFQMIELSSRNKKLFWVPAGFAHGFQVISKTAEVMYKVTNFWDPDDEYTLNHDDIDVCIPWSNISKVISQKDQQGLSLNEINTLGLYI